MHQKVTDDEGGIFLSLWISVDISITDQKVLKKHSKAKKERQPVVYTAATQEEPPPIFQSTTSMPHHHNSEVTDNDLNEHIYSGSSPTYVESINDSQINDEDVVRQAIAANKLRKYRLRQRRNDLLNRQTRFVYAW